MHVQSISKEVRVLSQGRLLFRVNVIYRYTVMTPDTGTVQYKHS